MLRDLTHLRFRTVVYGGTSVRTIVTGRAWLVVAYDGPPISGSMNERYTAIHILALVLPKAQRISTAQGSSLRPSDAIFLCFTAYRSHLDVMIEERRKIRLGVLKDETNQAVSTSSKIHPEHLHEPDGDV